LDNEIDRKIDVTAILFPLVQNRQQRHNWTLIGSGANGLGIQECFTENYNWNYQFFRLKNKDNFINFAHCE